jgi:hypothetical protein
MDISRYDYSIMLARFDDSNVQIITDMVFDNLPVYQ